MIKYFYFFSLVVLFSTPLSAQIDSTTFHTKIVYRLQVIPDSMDRANIRTEYINNYIGNDLNLCISQNTLTTDSISKAEQEKREAVSEFGGTYVYPIYPKTSLNQYIFESSNSQVLIEKLADDIYYAYTEPTLQYNWQLDSDSLRTINGMICQKATLNFGNRKWIAWFSTNTNIQGGPYKFTSLPGVVVSLYDESNNWKFDLVSIDKVVQSPLPVVLPSHKNIRYLEKKEFYVTKKNLRDNYLDLQVAAGKMVFNSVESYNSRKKLLEERNKKENNWIELYP